MHKHNKEDLTGHPSDYGSRTLAGEDDGRQRTEREEMDRTADGDPREDRGTADSAISRDTGGK